METPNTPTPPKTDRKTTRRLAIGLALVLLGALHIADALITPERRQKLGEKLTPKPGTDDPTAVQD